MKPFPGELRRSEHGGRPYLLTDEQREWFVHWFPKIENRRICEAMGVSIFTLYKISRELGITKSEAGMRSIRRRQRKAANRTCERNGYYDSIRGKSPSAATRAAVRKRWESVRRGETEHHVKKWKRENPERYHEFVEGMRESRRELIRKEKLRIKYGLERQTKLSMIVLYPYTRNQISCRRNALARGYLIDEDCSEGQPGRYVIYYDNNTVRNARFESTCIKHGFRIEPE